MLLATTTATAGGLLTNTNQNVAFLRNPARDAAIGIDGVYTNPAGVAFLEDGLHLSINWQNAHQTRTINTAYGPLFAMNAKRPAPLSADGFAYREFEGVADAPILPSLQAAYNLDGKWSFQFGFAVSGGGGKCEFDNGLGSFEGIVAGMIPQLNAQMNPALGLPDGQNALDKYSVNAYMKGRQYYFGFTLGAAYKLTDNLSVFGGLRLLYGNAHYEGYVKDIMLGGIATSNNMTPATNIFGDLKTKAANAAATAATTAANAQAAGDLAAAQAAQAQAETYKATATRMGGYEIVTKGINLDCNQNGLGIAPVIGVDYKIGKLNLAAKYDFKVRMRLKNSNDDATFNIIAAAVPQLAKYADGEKVAEDSPALLTLGAQYEITDDWRVMAGYHHFFDVDTKQWTSSDLSDTNEFNFGTEYDITDWLQASAGFQKTNYDFDDSFMNDISFNVSSWTFGLGVGVKVSDKVKLNAAYFQTNYDTMDVTSQAGQVKNSYTRTNRVFGLGCDIDF